ncbi:MAG: polysaccharide biosynthesis tyrosine autokinase [Elainellaceae cyanobacterium]
MPDPSNTFWKQGQSHPTEEKSIELTEGGVWPVPDVHLSGGKMPTRTNQPLPYGNYAPVQPVPNPAWNRQDTDDLDLTQMIKVVRRRGLLIGGVAITIASVIWGWTLTRTPVYQGRFRVLIESVDETDPSQQLLLEEAAQLGDAVDYDTQIEVLLSPVLLEPISRDIEEDFPNFTLPQLSEGLSINRLRETKVLEINYRGSDPQLIQTVLETVAQHYLEYSFEQRQESLKQGIQFVDDQLPELRDRVNELQVRLERFRQQYNLLDPNNRGADLSELLSGVESDRQQIQTELSEARSLYRSLQGQLRVSPEEALAAAALSESPRYQSLLNQMQEIESEIAVESAKYQPNSPQLQVLQERRDNLEPLLAEEAVDVLGDRFAASGSPRVDGNLTPTSIDLGRQLIDAANNVQMLQARSQSLAQVEQNLKQEFALVPSLARQYTDLQRELEIATESLNRFLNTRETLQIDAAQKSVPWQTIAEPSTSRIPISPNIPRNLMLGAVAGLLVGGVAALLAEKLDQVYHSPDELKDATQLPLLGIIPFHPELDEKLASVPATPDGAAMSENKRQQTYQSSMFFEGVRSVYTNIRFLGTDEPIRSLVVSSAIPGEGKTTSSLNLARAAAIMGQRVLVVDADLRSPKHHNRMQLSNMRGLSTLITESLRIEDVVQRSPLDENLHVLTAGPLHPDPVKLLSSRRMQTIMEQLRTAYDLVIYDMPPIVGFADSSLVAAHTDGIVMIVGLGKTERAAVIRALDEIQMSPVSVLGVVANGIKSYTTTTYGHYGYYSHYYSKTAAAATSAAEPVTSGFSSIATYETPRPGSSTSAEGVSPTSNPSQSTPAQTGWQFQEPDPQATSSRFADDPANDLTPEAHTPPHVEQSDQNGSGVSSHFPNSTHQTHHVNPPEPDSEAHPDADLRSLYETTSGWNDSPYSQTNGTANPVNGSSTTQHPQSNPTGSYADESEPHPFASITGLAASPRTHSGEAEDASAETQAATMQSKREKLNRALGSLPPWQRATAGIGAIALIGVIGWAVLGRVFSTPDSDPSPPLVTEGSSENPPAEPTEEGVTDGGTDPGTPPDSTETGSTSEGSTSPNPNGTGTEASDDPSASTGEPGLTPREVQEPFAEAVRLAERASTAGETAQAPEEWSQIAEQWQRASALMAIVPADSAQFETARDRTVLYRNNGEFARQKVLELLRDKDLSDLSN